MTPSHELSVFVISLRTSSERRKRCIEQMAAAGITFEFLDAIDGRKDRHPLLQRLRPDKFLIWHGRPPLPGEAGCYASHFLAWRKCLELNRPIIVLEDDFLLQPNAVEAFILACRLIWFYPFIRLEETRPTFLPFYTTRFTHGQYWLVRYLKVPQRTTCYAIAPPAAAALIRASDEFLYPVDYFIRHQYLHWTPIHGLYPAPVSPGRDQSEIGNRHLDKGPLWCTVTKQIHKINRTMLNAMANLVHCINERTDELPYLDLEDFNDKLEIAPSGDPPVVP